MYDDTSYVYYNKTFVKLFSIHYNFQKKKKKDTYKLKSAHTNTITLNIQILD